MSPAEYSLMLGFGFLSSIHCVQMCGPLVLTYSVAANTAEGRRAFLPLHLAYNAGRTLTYMLLGAAAGLAGGAMGWLGHLAGIEHVAAIVAGVAMILAAIVMSGFAPGMSNWPGFAFPARMLRPVGKLIAAPTARAKLALGLVLGFMPCGLIYAALIKAVGTGSAANGALTMMAFGLGTSVALIAVGLGSSAATQKLARWGRALSALAVLVMGVLLIEHGLFAHPLASHGMHSMVCH